LSIEDIDKQNEMAEEIYPASFSAENTY